MLLKRILTEEGAKEFKTLLKGRQCEKLAEYFRMICEHQVKEFNKPTVRGDLLDPSWPLTRAYRDGGEYYLQQLLNLFTEDK